MPGEDPFATPQAKKICLDGASFSATPGKSVTTFEIPPSPCLQRLGFGTGKYYKMISIILKLPNEDHLPH